MSEIYNFNLNNEVKVIKVNLSEDATKPEFKTEEAACADIHAYLPGGFNLILDPGKRILIPTGLCMEIPQGLEVLIRPRSGLALKHGITVLNTPGTVDSDYVEEIGVILINHGENPFVINHGDRIAQMAVRPIFNCRLELTDSITKETSRAGGFGSTGI
ncbi:MAG: dUTP diphosphatase [Paraclostridium sp.]